MESNFVSETLQRSFAAADEAIFHDAVKSPSSKQCYRTLAAMHDSFCRLGLSVQLIQNASTDKNDLETKIAELAARNTAEAIVKITGDLKSLHDENARLKVDAARHRVDL